MLAKVKKDCIFAVRYRGIEQYPVSIMGQGTYREVLC